MSSFELFEIFKQGISINIIGSYAAMLLLALFIIILILAFLKINKYIAIPLILPIIYVFTKYIGWLYLIIAFIIGFALSKALIKLFNQES